MAGSEDPKSGLMHDATIVGLVAAPFFLNDFLFMTTETTAGWLAVDYGSKLIGLGLVFFILPSRKAALESLPLRWPATEVTVLALGAAVVIIGADSFFRLAVPIEVESLVLFRYPVPTLPVLYWTDITFGLLLTAFSEEIVFRGVFANLMARHLKSPVSIVVVSAVVFALIHWSHGVTSMVVAGIAGLVLMGLYLRTGSVLPAVAAHYLVNLVDFA